MEDFDDVLLDRGDCLAEHFWIGGALKGWERVSVEYGIGADGRQNDFFGDEWNISAK